MKFINPYVKSVFYSCLILFGLGTISIAPIWITFIGIFWPIPLLKETDNHQFLFTAFALITMLIIRTFLFEDFQGTLLLIPYLVATAGMLWCRLFYKKNTMVKELIVGIILNAVTLFVVLFYLTVILGLFHLNYFLFQTKQLLRDTIIEQSKFLKIYLGEGNLIDKIETFAFYMSKLLVGILVSFEIVGITFIWHLSAPKEKRIIFTKWKGNYILIWGLILGLLCLNFGLLFNNLEVTFIGINILIIYGVILFILGLAAFVDSIKNLSFWILVLAGLLLFLAPQTLFILLLLGFANCFTKKNIIGGFNDENHT